MGVLLVSATFEAVLVFLEFLLLLSSFLTVMGVIVLRVRRPELERPYKCWGYPVTPLLFLAISGWMMFYILREKPAEALWGLGTLLAGAVLFAVAKRMETAPIPTCRDS